MSYWQGLNQMIEKIVVFYGSRKDFDNVINDRVQEDEVTIPFMDLIQHYNARLRPNESGVRESALSQNISVDNCIVRADDYASVLEHVLGNFVNIVTLNHDVGTIYIQNPPKRVLRSLVSAYDEGIEYLYSDYIGIDRDVLKSIHRQLNDKILGQELCKKQLISGLYKLLLRESNKPAVLMLYGPSGVGKTETAKCISEVLGGELLRVQFSMMQTNEAYNYIFGSEHSKSSFAKDMMSRETNVILIDEFDKVNSVFYNAFYELFDEGRYVDANYDVDLKNTIFLCTCNFRNETEIKTALGPAMYSRIGCCIEYTDLSKEQKCAIIEKRYNQIINELKDDEKEVVIKTDILEWFKSNAERYDNIRILKTKLENAIFDELVDVFIYET